MSNFYIFVPRQLASRQSDDTVSMVHYPPNIIQTPVSSSGAGDWYVYDFILYYLL